MRRSVLPLAVAAFAALSGLPSLAAAEVIGGNPGPQYNYICPHADGKGALDCYFDAVEHLYTMCRNVKSIEILEFGYENSRQGVNNAKYEYCVDKQKLNMAKPFKAALKEAHLSRQAVEALHGLQEDWLVALQKIQWVEGETDAEYKARLARAYERFHQRIAGIRTIVAVVQEKTAPAAHAKAKAHARPVKREAAHKARPKAAAKAGAPAKASPAPLPTPKAAQRSVDPTPES